MTNQCVLAATFIALLGHLRAETAFHRPQLPCPEGGLSQSSQSGLFFQNSLLAENGYKSLSFPMPTQGCVSPNLLS